MSERSPDVVLWDVLRGAMRTKALAVVVDAGLPDALANGPRPADELARDAGLSPDVIRRVLRALASDGIFTEVQPGVFGHNETSELLRNTTWPDFGHLFGGVFYEAVGTLDRAAVEGEVVFSKALGAEFWTWLAERPVERSAFDRAMAGGKAEPAGRLAELEWRNGEVVVDVGGGNGALLIELLRLRPDLRGLVFDLPATDRDESAFGEKLEFVAGSFFEHVPEGDTYVLSRILHDWGDEPAAAILRTIRAAAPDHARLLVLDSVIPPGDEPHGAKWLDLLMLVLAGGRERTEEEWRALLQGAGWRPERIEDSFIEARCR
jgi:hypothetical protein